jgi:hypothetical protein
MRAPRRRHAATDGWMFSKCRHMSYKEAAGKPMFPISGPAIMNHIRSQAGDRGAAAA